MAGVPQRLNEPGPDRTLGNNMTESFAQLFEQSLASQRIKAGQILNGYIVEVGPDMVIVNVGLKSEAAIPLDQFKILDFRRAFRP